VVATQLFALARTIANLAFGVRRPRGLLHGFVFDLLALSVLGVVAALVMLPGVVRGSRYRPARGWGARPVWFAGPVQPEAAIAGAQTGDVVRGGASGSW
jgi:hypothetical protein